MTPEDKSAAHLAREAKADEALGAAVRPHVRPILLAKAKLERLVAAGLSGTVQELDARVRYNAAVSRMVLELESYVEVADDPRFASLLPAVLAMEPR